MWRAPNRPKHEITQTFNNGIVTIYSVADEAQPGFQPRQALTKKAVLRYEERKVGIQRYYAAAQNQVQVSRVIRTPWTGKLSSQDVAVTEDGQQYRIDLCQNVPDVYPPCVDLTLVAIAQNHEVSI